MGPVMDDVPCKNYKSVIGHGIGGINFPDIMARLAKMQDRWSKRWQACLSSPDLEASQISDG